MTKLTALDRITVGQANELVSLRAEAIEQRGPYYVVGQAQDVIRELVALVSRLTEDTDPDTGPT